MSLHAGIRLACPRRCIRSVVVRPAPDCLQPEGLICRHAIRSARSLHDVGRRSLVWRLADGGGRRQRRGRIRPRSRDRARVAAVGWGRWAPVSALSIGAHLLGGSAVLYANRGRARHQSGGDLQHRRQNRGDRSLPSAPPRPMPSWARKPPRPVVIQWKGPPTRRRRLRGCRIRAEVAALPAMGGADAHRGDPGPGGPSRASNSVPARFCPVLAARSRAV